MFTKRDSTPREKIIEGLRLLNDSARKAVCFTEGQ